jgi:hypothetical protein
MPAELQAPGYLHVLINHLPIIGSAVGLFGLLIALLLRNRLALVPALAIVILSGLSAWPVYITGSDAYRPIMKILDESGRAWLNEHRDRADGTIWIFYLMAGIGTAALVAPCKWPKSALPLGIATAFSVLAALGAAGYIAQAGGLIRHVEFRVPSLIPPSE